MRNFVSAICALFALLCVFSITGCGGGGGNGVGIKDPPPGQGVTLYGNATMTSDLQNPIVVLIRLPSFVGADQIRTSVVWARIGNVKGAPGNPYKLVVPSDAPIGRYVIALYDHAGDSPIDFDNEGARGGFHTTLHLPKDWYGYDTKADYWAYSANDPGPELSQGGLNIISWDATKTSADFTTGTRTSLEDKG